MITHSSYGKERVRLVQVLRRSDRHDVRDLTVDIQFEGDYDAWPTPTATTAPCCRPTP